MPLPTPRPDENEEEWLERCMGDQTMVTEFPDEKQRFAVCLSIWNEEDGEEMNRLHIYSEAEMREMEQRFVSSPRNKYGTHSSVGFKGNYAAAWRCHFSQVNGGRVDPESCGPIQGTIRRCEMIAAAMKPPCDLPKADNIPPRSGPPSPLDCTFPEKPSDYGLSKWADPADDGLTREDIALSCKDLAIIKKAAVAELKRRIQDREKQEEEKSRNVIIDGEEYVSPSVSGCADVDCLLGDIELRTWELGELRVSRSQREDSIGVLIGSPAIPYGQWSSDLGGFIERVHPSALDATLEKYDVVCCRDHEDSLILGRVSARTLRLQNIKSRGLCYECDLPDVSYARDLIASVKRGDVVGNSFRFTVLRDKWSGPGSDGMARREILEMELYEVGPVTMPAYTSTSLSLRSLLRSVGVDAAALAVAVRKVRSGDGSGWDIDIIHNAIRALRECLPSACQGTAGGADTKPQGRLKVLRQRLELLERMM